MTDWTRRGFLAAAGVTLAAAPALADEFTATLDSAIKA